jgi:hypothetical protein
MSSLLISGLLALAGRFQPLATRTLGALALETPP